MPSQRILFTSDLHSRRDLCGEMVHWAAELRPQLVLLGGDLFGGDPRAQVAFACGPFLDTVRQLRQAGVQRIGVLPGNDDWSAALDALRERDSERLLHWLADAPLDLDADVNVLGYAFVPLTPFSVKDHEKLDHYRPDKREVLEAMATGVASRDGGGVNSVTKPLDGSESIEKDLCALSPLVRPGRSLFVSHCPPRGTQLDLAFGRHVGSQALREFLLRARPALSLHGHIPPGGGVFAEWVGETLAVNVGQGTRLHAVHFESHRPAETLVHTVLGPWRGAPARPDMPPVRAPEDRPT